MELHTQELVLNGKKIRYLYGGKGKKLLFLHGWPMQPRHYVRSLGIVAERFEVYAPFLFDFPSGTFSEMAACVEEMLAKLGITRIAVAGTSFGGAIAAIIASRRPDMVRRLVLANSAGLPMKISAAGVFAQAAKNWRMLAAKRKFAILCGIFLGGMYFSAGLLAEQRRALLRDMRTTTLEAAFKRIRAKTLIAWSREDRLFPASYARFLNQAIKNSRVALVQGAHGWPNHQPELFASLIMQGAK